MLRGIIVAVEWLPRFKMRPLTVTKNSLNGKLNPSQMHDSRHVTLNTELLTSTTVAPETLSSFLHVIKIDKHDASIHIHLATITGEYSTNLIYV